MKRIKTNVTVAGSTHYDWRTLCIDDVASGMRLIRLDAPAEDLLQLLMRKDGSAAPIFTDNLGVLEEMLPEAKDPEHPYPDRRKGHLHLRLQDSESVVVMTISGKGYPYSSGGLLSVRFSTKHAAIALMCTLYDRTSFPAVVCAVDARIGKTPERTGSLVVRNTQWEPSHTSLPKELRALWKEGRLTFSSQSDGCCGGWRIYWQAWAEPVSERKST
jgi:hypothetical protein